MKDYYKVRLSYYNEIGYWQEDEDLEDIYLEKNEVDGYVDTLTGSNIDRAVSYAKANSYKEIRVETILCYEFDYDVVSEKVIWKETL